MLPVLEACPSLKGKKLYVFSMAYGSARAFAAALRAVGVDAEPTPPSDERTRELGGRYTSGDECYPAKVTVGDFMKLVEAPGADPARMVLFMPTADGPCRFGQYAPYLRHLLAAAGHADVEVISPSSKNGYDAMGEVAKPFVRTGWRALLAADILQKLLLQHRPFEINVGESESVYEESLADLCQVIETSTTESGAQLAAMRECLIRCRDRFRGMRIRRESSTPLIGIVGEIFCRLNTFSNENLVRRLEEYGGEAWLSDIGEWIWYTNSEHFRTLKLRGRLWTAEALGAWIRHPDALVDFSLWREFGAVLCVENMDKRKPIGRTVRELARVFEQLPEASLCFDVGHARQCDATMTEACLILREFGSKLRQVHVSEVNTRSKHDPLSYASILAYQEIAHLIPATVPLILETPVAEDQMEAEIAKAREALPIDREVMVVS